MKDKILQLIKTRDDDFIKRFCMKGAYMDEHGKIIGGVCRNVPAEELLEFIHVYDAYIREELSKES